MSWHIVPYYCTPLHIINDEYVTNVFINMIACIVWKHWEKSLFRKKIQIISFIIFPHKKIESQNSKHLSIAIFMKVSKPGVAVACLSRMLSRPFMANGIAAISVRKNRGGRNSKRWIPWVVQWNKKKNLAKKFPPSWEPLSPRLFLRASHPGVGLEGCHVTFCHVTSSCEYMASYLGSAVVNHVGWPSSLDLPSFEGTFWDLEAFPVQHLMLSVYNIVSSFFHFLWNK